MAVLPGERNGTADEGGKKILTATKERGKTSVKKPQPTAELQAFWSQLVEQGKQLEALRTEVVFIKRVMELADELSLKGPNIRLVGPNLTGLLPASQVIPLFTEGYKQAMTDFVRALKGDFAGLEASLREEILSWNIDPHEWETAWGETAPEC